MSDVCLVVEGSYPYIRGGVSEWVHRLITDMPDLQFSLLSIMPSQSYTREENYRIPNNVESIVNVYLHDYQFKDRFFKKRTPELFDFFDIFYGDIDKRPKEELEKLLLKLMNNRGGIDLSYAFSSRDLWNSMLKTYNSGDTSTTFLDFFWNYRFTFLPLVQRIKTNIPPAPLYHTISTGYAGVLASLAKIKFNSNMLLTEHGIYTKERRIEIAQATWLYESEEESMKATSSLGFFKNWWIRYFGAMSKLAYRYADQITTLYEGNKLYQISDGADPQKISIIPNGVVVNQFREIAQNRDISRKRRTVAYIGRVVPIKDVKTFIKACKLIVQKIPDAEFLLIGPQEEESQYYQECADMVNMLGLEKNVKFTGHVNVTDHFPKIDLIVLTSISEAQPLVILEGAACGIPVVTTDVGSCRELVEGRTDEDKELGKSGLLTSFHAPGETAAAVINLLTDDVLYNKMSEAGISRVEQYYNVADMVNAYKTIYGHYI